MVYFLGRKETEKRGLQVKYSVADMREAYAHHSKRFDLLVSCDNSVPHLLTDSDILKAFREFFCCLKHRGGCLITLRDYENECREGIQVKPYDVRVENGIKHIILQTWEFSGDIYELTMYIIRDDQKKEVKTQVLKSKYYAISTSKIIKLLKDTGFRSVKQIESDFYQPVIVATKP